MTMQKCNEKANKGSSLDGYAIFFWVLFVFGFLFPLLGIVGIDIIHDNVHNPTSVLGKIILYLASTLGVTAIFAGFQTEISAKKMFWLWMGFSVLVAVGCVVGAGEIWLFKQIFL